MVIVTVIMTMIVIAAAPLAPTDIPPNPSSYRLLPLANESLQTPPPSKLIQSSSSYWLPPLTYLHVIGPAWFMSPSPALWLVVFLFTYILFTFYSCDFFSCWFPCLGKFLKDFFFFFYFWNLSVLNIPFFHIIVFFFYLYLSFLFFSRIYLEYFSPRNFCYSYSSIFNVFFCCIYFLLYSIFFIYIFLLILLFLFYFMYIYIFFFSFFFSGWFIKDFSRHYFLWHDSALFKKNSKADSENVTWYE